MFKKKHVKPEATFGEVFKQGDLATKLSFFLMGIAQLKNKQGLKGLVFLATEIIFLLWLISSGLVAISLLGNLGAVKTKQVVFDEAQGVYVTKLPDNSMIILLFGVIALLSIIMMVILYRVALRSTRHLYVLNRDGKHIPTTMEDLASLLDKRLHATLMLVPLLGILVFTVAPLFFMVALAFTNYSGQHGIGFSWTGLQAFGQIFSGDYAAAFMPIILWTLIWAICATSTTFLFGVLLAMLIESKGIKFKAFWRTLFVIVFAIPQFVSLLMMSQMLDDSGPVNTFLLSHHLIASKIPFLTDPIFAKITVIGVNMWIGIPVSMLITTAIIQNLPQDQIEAARIDGASIFQIFRNITFPQILFVMMPSLIQQFIGNINNFGVIFLLTGGGPNTDSTLANVQAGTTDLLITWLYKLNMNSYSYNVASAIGIVMFILTATFSLIAYRRTNTFKEA
ncbi:MAG: sugar ABC transporter permease [Streptococcaceae bacterium]|jgi:arabinogalactan oligomer/maltooligosaccharide transport system permease protein|nr:sugar ABC transporter permease [Streptococcaceae bacterium]